MSPRIAWLLIATLALPSVAFAQAEDQVVNTIRNRLEASRRNDMVETHVRRDGRWLLLGVADGLIPPEPKAAKIDPAILDAYVGHYEWAPTLIAKVERKGDRLLERLGAGGDSSRIIFVKDSGGRVTHYIYRELGGTDRIVKKVK